MLRSLLFYLVSFVTLAPLATTCAQSYIDEFTGGLRFIRAPAGITTGTQDGILSLTGDSTSGAFAATFYSLNVDGAAATLDVTGGGDAAKLFIRARSSVPGTTLRVDLVDVGGYVTSVPALTRRLDTGYTVLEYDFTGLLAGGDGGLGGSTCTAEDAPCDVDGAEIASLYLYVDPGVGAFAGRVEIDYVAFGEPDGEGGGQEVYRDRFEADDALAGWVTVAPGFTALAVGDSAVQLIGDGTGEPYAANVYEFRDSTTGQPITVDFGAGGDKLVVRMAASMPGTEVRVDLQDRDGLVSTLASRAQTIDTAYAEYTYLYAGGYADLGYGGTTCSQSAAPCPLDSSLISSLIFTVEPGVGGYAGTLTIDDLSVLDRGQGAGGSAARPRLHAGGGDARAVGAVELAVGKLRLRQRLHGVVTRQPSAVLRRRASGARQPRLLDPPTPVRRWAAARGAGGWQAPLVPASERGGERLAFGCAVEARERSSPTAPPPPPRPSGAGQPRAALAVGKLRLCQRLIGVVRG